MTSNKFDSCQHFLGPYHQEEIFLVQTYQGFLIGEDSISLISCRVRSSEGEELAGSTRGLQDG